MAKTRQELYNQIIIFEDQITTLQARLDEAEVVIAALAEETTGTVDCDCIYGSAPSCRDCAHYCVHEYAQKYITEVNDD